MNLVSTASMAFIFSVAMTTALPAEEPLPTCSDATVGSSCVVMRDSIGPWHIEEVEPPVGSQNALVMSVESFQELPGIFNRPERAELVLSCVENTTRIEVRFGENFMSDSGEYGQLIYKMDDQAPLTIHATASPKNDALGIYNGTPAIRLITSLFGANRLFVSATTFTGRTLTASFQIEQLEDAVVPLRKLCNW